MDFKAVMDSMVNVQVAAVRAGYETREKEVEGLKRERDEAVECLRDVLELIEGYEDAADGSDGPIPNKAMHAGNAIRDFLAKHGG